MVANAMQYLKLGSKSSLACLGLDFLTFVGDGSDPYLLSAWSYYYHINQFILRNLTRHFANALKLVYEWELKGEKMVWIWTRMSHI